MKVGWYGSGMIWEWAGMGIGWYGSGMVWA